MLHPTRITRWVVVILAAVLALPVIQTASPATPAAPNMLRAHAQAWPDRAGQPAVDRARQALAAQSAQAAHHPPVDPARQTQQTAEWTVLVFVAADNNIEMAALLDLNEMEVIGSTADVNIVVQVDRAEYYANADGDWTEARRYYIQQDQDPAQITSPVLQNLGEIDSGSADAVADFAIWGITNYPARKYMLVLWDHGGAWASHFSDEQAGTDATLPDLVSALDRVRAETGLAQFEVLGFDMCLMGQMEVFQTITPYARYGIGSQENEPGAGWYYLFLEQLTLNPQMDGAELGRHVVDYYMYFFTDVLEMDDVYGLSVVDLGQSAQMAGAMDQLVAAVQANPQASLSAVSDARNNTLAYGGFDDPQYYEVWSSVDLYQFADLLADLSTVPAVQQAAQGVMQSVDRYVIYEDHHYWLDGSHGVSVYFPANRYAYQLVDFDERYPREAPASMASWVTFLDLFHGTANATVTAAPSVAVTGVYPEMVSIYNPSVVTVEVTGRDVLQVNYSVAYVRTQDERIVLDYDYLIARTTTPGGVDIINWADGLSERTFIWEAEVPVLTDGIVTTYGLILPNRDNPDIAVVNGDYIPANGDPTIEAQLVFDLNERRSTAVWGINEMANGSLQPFQLQVQLGDQFRPLWLTMDADYDLATASYGEVLTLADAQSITFEKQPAPSGEYAISFIAENVTGEKRLDETIIQVDNDGVDASLRGYTDLTYGVNFQYPADWIRPRFTQDGKRLFTGDLATNTVLTLYPYTDVSSAAETDAAIRASWNQLQNLQITNEREVTISGLPAYVTDYTYVYDGEPRIGAVIAIYVPEQGVGYGFDLDAPASNTEPAQAALQALVDSINFFEPAQLAGTSAWQRVSLADGAVTLPVPAEWVREDRGDWAIFGPPDDATVFLALGAAETAGRSQAALAEHWVGNLRENVDGLAILAGEPYYVAGREWYLVVFTYEDTVKMAGAFFATTQAGGNDYIFWLEAPDAEFDALYAQYFSVAVDGFMLNE